MKPSDTLTINNITITTELLETLQYLGLNASPKDDLIREYIDTLTNANDFIIDYLSEYFPADESVLQKTTELLVTLKATRDGLTRMHKNILDIVDKKTDN